MKVTKRKRKYFKKRLHKTKRFFCLVLLVFFHCSLVAQGVDDFTESFKSKRSFYFTWDSKATFITNEYAQVKSVKLGFDFGGKTKFGMGYNWYKGNIERPFYESATLMGKLKFRYASIFTEYVYFLNNRWEASIPAQIGLGIMQYNYSISKQKIENIGGVFMLYEPSSVLVYRFLRYFGAGLGIGYRLVILTGNNPNKENFNSPIISIRTKIYFDRVIEDLKKVYKKDR